MPKSIISEGKTTKEAIDNGLAKLKISKDMVDVKILDNEEKRSFFSILSPRVVKVELTVKENINRDMKKPESTTIVISKDFTINKPTDASIKEAIFNIEEFIKKWIVILNINIKYDIKVDGPYVKVNITGDDLNHLIGYRGEVLNSIQNLFTSIANKNINEKVRILVDIENYREKRGKTLEDLAEKIAKTVIRNGKTITLEPMSSFERKIIHTKLQSNTKVRTESVGEEPYRKVVISLNK